MQTRGLTASLLCLLLLAPAAVGDETPPPLAARNFELLPLNDLERGELARDHPDLVRRVTILAQRAAKLRKHRLSRKDPNDDGGRRIADQLSKIEVELAPLIAKAVEVCRDKGIDARLLAFVAQAPDGPHRVARYAMGLVLYVEGTPERPRTLMSALLPKVEGALLALEGQKQRLRLATEQSGLEQPVREALLAAFDQQVRTIEKRWWRLVDYVVPQAQRAAIHRVLPRTYQQPESVLQHVFGLPGLRASQATRVRAMLEEVQAQAAPDNAAVKRLQVELRDPKTPGTRKAAIPKEMKAAQVRLLELQRWAVDETKGILTAAQWEALEAVPPRVSFQDRRATSVDVLAGVDLSAAQQARLDRMRQELSAYRRAYQERRIKTAAKGAMMGPDSPQMAGMQMEMANIEAEGNRMQRRFNGRVMLELLTPEQVAAWVIAPSAQR